jgi:hypothetical protein
MVIRDRLTELGHKLPPINFGLGKGLRDVAVHPATLLSNLDGVARVDQCTIYNLLSVQFLEDLGKQLGDWCDAVSTITGHPRFSETKKALKEVAKKLAECVSGVGPIKKI